MTITTLLTSLFHYKADADRDLLGALAAAGERLRPEDLLTARRLLKHMHLVDIVFAANIRGITHGFTSTWRDDAPPLDQLSIEIRALDQWYIDYLGKLSAGDLAETLTFTFTDGTRGRMSRAEMLAHLVTHAGFHRGEIGRLLPGIEATAMRDVFAGWLHQAEPERREPAPVAPT